MEFDIERNVRIKVEDGTDIVGDIYIPDGNPPFPSIVFRTPYNRDDERFRKYARFFASNGFVFLNSDVRGRGDSDGEFLPYFKEGKDGRDLVEWAAAQPWSNSRVGTFGASYSARIQWLTALERPKGLSAMISIVSPSDPFVESPTGVTDPMHISWRYMVSGRTLKNPDGINWKEIYETLPLKDIPKRLGISFESWEEDGKHKTLDEYWKRIQYQNKFSEINVPVMHVSGWYDDEQIGTFINFVGMKKNSPSSFSRENQVMIMGPWGHNVNSDSKLGDVNFGPGAIIDLERIYSDWFRWTLGGAGAEYVKDVKLFIMGTNKWKNFDDWPPENTRECKLFLSSNGKANSRFGDGKLEENVDSVIETQDSYRYDPLNPTPFLTEVTSKQIGGPDDYSSIERRDDVLVYDSPLLENDSTVLGKVETNLLVSTDGKDTDFMAMLLDVWPTGYAQRLCDGMTRGRYRYGMDKEELFEPGKIYELKLDMWNTGHTFKKNHKVRLQISSSAFPKYSRNLNTGLDLINDSTVRTSTNSVFHSKKYQSYLGLNIYEE